MKCFIFPQKFCVVYLVIKWRHNTNFIYVNFRKFYFFDKGNLLLKLKHVGNVVWSFLKKNKGFIILVAVVVVCSFCWTNISSALSSKAQTFILTCCCEYLYISVCIWYDDSFTEIKQRNAHEVTLRAVLEMLFVCLCPYWDVTRMYDLQKQKVWNLES